MKKNIILLSVVVFILTGCGIFNDIYAQKEILDSREKIVNSPYINYKKNIQSDYPIVVMQNANNVCILYGKKYFYNISNDKLIYVDNNHEEYSTFKQEYVPLDPEWTDMYDNWYDVYFSDLLLMGNGAATDLYCKYWDSSYLGKVRKQIDTIIENKPYILYYTKNNNAKDIRYNDIIYYYNKTLGLIDKIKYKGGVTDEISRQYIELEYMFESSDFSFENNEKIIDTMFSINNDRYAFYTKCNDTILPVSSILLTSSEDTVMTKKILNYPLVNVNNDTTCIAKYNGWLLLDFWGYFCKPCLEYAETLQKEKKQYGGKTILENKGVKILAINHDAADIKRLKQFVKRYDMDYMFFGAKDIQRYLNIPKLPTYYLISPEKRTVYVHEGELKNYDKILNIIANYKNKN